MVELEPLDGEFLDCDRTGTDYLCPSLAITQRFALDAQVMAQVMVRLWCGYASVKLRIDANPSGDRPPIS